MRDIPNDSVDLVFGSPPYEDARTYGIDFKLKGQDWVDWMVEIYEESIRISKGLVAFVIQGRTRKFKWSCTPALLITDLHRAGFNVRNPPIYNRSGIPGSGGPDWLRSDYEWVVCVSKPGRLVWSDNVACGHEPICGPGGDPTHRKKDGERVRRAFRVGKTIKTAPHASHGGRSGTINKDGTITRKDGSIYEAPKIANPGNVIRCSGGHLGNKLAHENEAPFPLKLAEFFVKSFCPPNGTTLDPFCGSSTTGHACVLNGRNY
ncbi:unnamed protein product, partial [marine sediment metagenome]